MGLDLELKRSGKLTNSPQEYDFIFSVQRLKYRRSKKESFYFLTAAKGSDSYQSLSQMVEFWQFNI